MAYNFNISNDMLIKPWYKENNTLLMPDSSLFTDNTVVCEYTDGTDVVKIKTSGNVEFSEDGVNFYLFEDCSSEMQSQIKDGNFNHIESRGDESWYIIEFNDGIEKDFADIYLSPTSTLEDYCKSYMEFCKIIAKAS